MAMTNPNRGKPKPIIIPIAATNHIVAAVVLPTTFSPDLRMTPPPRNPTPLTTWAAILLGSIVAGAPAKCQDRIDARVNSAEPEQMKMLVLNPAGFDACSLSNPMSAPQKRDTESRMKALCCSNRSIS